MINWFKNLFTKADRCQHCKGHIDYLNNGECWCDSESRYPEMYVYLAEVLAKHLVEHTQPKEKDDD